MNHAESLGHANPLGKIKNAGSERTRAAAWAWFMAMATTGTSAGCATKPTAAAVAPASASIGAGAPTASPAFASTPAARRRAPPAPPAPPVVLLEFDDLAPVVVAGATPITPGKLLAAKGRTVRMVGYMAHMEIPPAHGFYLTRTPVFCDEAGGGTADLPPDAMRVVGWSTHDSQDSPVPVAYLPGRLEVVGTLDVGTKEDPDGTVSRVRIVLGEP